MVARLWPLGYQTKTRASTDSSSSWGDATCSWHRPWRQHHLRHLSGRPLCRRHLSRSAGRQWTMATAGRDGCRRGANDGTKTEPIGATICGPWPSASSAAKFRVMGSKIELLRTLAATAAAESAAIGVRSLVPKWRATQNKTANSYVIEIVV